ncbi:MAG: class I SAM-dependent methyltransferase [Vicinamibacterales bacterium]
MRELLKAIRLFGLPYLRKLGRGYRAGWGGLFGGYVATHACHALVNVGLIDRMLADGDVDIAAFAAAERLDLAVLRPLCEALYSDRLMDRVAGTDRYRLSDRGRATLEVLKGWLEVSYGYGEVFGSLEEMLRGTKVYARDFYRKSEYVARGSGEMENWLLFPLANEIIQTKGYTRVLDLGCGDGTFLRKLCALNTNVQCFGIDLAPAAIEDGKVSARAAGLQDRISLHAADVQDVQDIPAPFRTVQVATIFFVLHEILYLGEDRLIAFLQAYRRNFPGVPLVAFEAIRPTADQMRKRPGLGIFYYLYHDLTHQKPVGREKWRQLFRAAGFASIDERYLGYSRTAIYTVV